MRDPALPPGPSWTDVVRFPPGTRLRVELTIRPAVREAIERASDRAARLFASLDHAKMHIERLSDAVCALRCSTSDSWVELVAEPEGTHAYAIRGRVSAEGVEQTFAISDILLQRGGRTDAYVTHAPVGERHQLLRAHYGAGPDEALVSVFTSSLALHLPAAIRVVVPSELEVARLVVDDDRTPAPGTIPRVTGRR